MNYSHYSKLRGSLIVFIAIVGLGMGCSDSTGPTYPLNLTLLPYSKHPIYDTLQFQVTENGKALAGAKLVSTTYPVLIQTILTTSDTNGKFPPLPIALNDSFTEIAYQAEIGSLASNPIDWAWY
jgi:hypothetical protein